MQFRVYQKEFKNEVEEIFKLYWNDPEYLEELSVALDSDICKFYVVEENNEIVGVAGIRNAENYLKEYTSTSNPVELYLIASKTKGKGIGSELTKFIIEESKKLGYTEIILYSPETHNGSWGFYEKNGFIQHGIVNDPDDGYPGMVWRRVL
jgi:L-amino acid N-acyltransferase YncA